MLLSTGCPFTSFVTIQPQNRGKVRRTLFIFFLENIFLLLILLGSKKRFRISLTTFVIIQVDIFLYLLGKAGSSNPIRKKRKS